MNNDVKLYRLNTGEMVIGRDDGEIIKEAYAIRIIPKNEQEVQTVMSPFFAPLSGESVEISMSHIISTIKANGELEQKYRQITSGIITPNSRNMPPNLHALK